MKSGFSRLLVLALPLLLCACVAPPRLPPPAPALVLPPELDQPLPPPGYFSARLEEILNKGWISVPIYVPLPPKPTT